MLRARQELGPLAFPVFLCVAAWCAILSRPSAVAQVTPQPRARVELPRPTRRPPTPLRAPPRSAAEAPVTTAEAPDATEAPTASSVMTSGEPVELETLNITGFGISSDYESDWSDRSYRWERWFYYHRRAWAERWQRIRAERARRVRSVMEPGAAGSIPADDARVSLCDVFSGACGGVGGARPTAVRCDENVATLRREGRSWVLSNGLVDAVIDPDALCALAVTRHRGSVSDALPPITLHDGACEVVETAAPDAMGEQGAVAVSLTWRGATVWQQAVVSLADGADGPETSVTRVSTASGRPSTTLLNLTASPLTWTLRGREVTVPSASTARVGG